MPPVPGRGRERKLTVTTDLMRKLARFSTHAGAPIRSIPALVTRIHALGEVHFSHVSS